MTLPGPSSDLQALSDNCLKRSRTRSNRSEEAALEQLVEQLEAQLAASREEASAAKTELEEA